MKNYLTTQQLGLTKETFFKEVRQQLLYWHHIVVSDKELKQRWKAGDNVENAISYFLIHR